MPRVPARARLAADRLARGSALVSRRRASALADWVKRGRRADLTGWRAALGPLARLAVLALLAWLLYLAVRALPWLMWVLTAAWCWAAWHAARPTPQEAAAESPAAPSPEPVRTLLTDLVGDRSGVHLKTVLAHLQERGQGEGWTVTDLRVRLEALGIPVKKIKAGGKSPTVGVHRDDLSAPSPGEDPGPSPSSSTAA